MNKQKLLKALNISIEDISEDRLVDILLDAYKAKNDEVSELESANAQERERLYNDRKVLDDEFRRMRCDPLMFPRGEYYFECDGRKFCVIVQGKVEMYERRSKSNVDLCARQLSPVEWNSR